MKHWLLMVAMCFSTLPAASSSSLPVALTEGVYVEAAWLRDTAEGSELFLVVNNTTQTPFDLVRIDVSGISGTIVSPTGSQASVSIPFRAELYMTEGGLRVAVPASFQPFKTIPVTLASSNGAISTIEATVLQDDAELPDHHDYPH